MFADLGGLTGIKNAITTVINFCKQKGKNDTELEKQVATLQANLDTMNSLQKKLEDRFKKCDEEDKEMWKNKSKMLQNSSNEFTKWINERNEQSSPHKVRHSGSQRDEIHSNVLDFQGKLQDFNNFLDNMVKCEQLDHGKQTVENTKQIAGNTQQIAENTLQISGNIQQIAENTSGKSEEYYEIPQLADAVKDKYKNDPELANLNTSFSVQEYYINLAIVENKEQREKEKKLENAKDIDDIRGTYEEIYGTKTTILVEDIFKNSKNPKQILLLGRAGIGKSTFCKYVINRWARDELWPEYKLVILIQLRKLTKEMHSADSTVTEKVRYNVLDLVKNEYEIDVETSADVASRFKDNCKKGEILWILDGYDEFVQNIPEKWKKPFNEIIKHYHHILTSRPYAMNLSYDITMEIIGFTDDNVAAFVKQRFNTTSEASHVTQPMWKTVLNFLKSNPTIWGIAHIPINLYLIYNNWSALKLPPKELFTVTDLYHRLVMESCLVYREKPDPLDEKLTDDEIEVGCAQHLEFFEKVAYGALQSNTIIMGINYLSTIAEKMNLNSHELEMKEFLKLGFLKYYDDNLDIKGTPIKKQYYFLHLSFQEFFAARHLVRILSSAKKNDAHNFIQENKYNQRFTLVFIFAFGLLRHQNDQNLLKDYWKSIEYEARDLIGLRHIKLLIECLDEMDGDLYLGIRKECIASIVPWINRAAKTDHTTVRRHLCNSFMRTTTLASDEKIISTLTELSKQPRGHVFRFYEVILWCVSHMPQPSLKVVLLVIERTKQENYEVIIRLNACKALGKIGKEGYNSTVITGLLKVLTDDKDSGVKRAACKALGEIGKEGDNSNLINALLEVLKDNADNEVKKAACYALGEIGKAGDNNKVISDLLEVLKGNADNEVKKTACEALREIGKAGDNSKVIVALLEVLEGNADNEVKKTACEALGEIGKAGDDSKVIRDLLEVLKNNADSRVRGAACEALSKIDKAEDNSKVIEALLGFLTKDKDSELKWPAYRALCEIGRARDNSKVISDLLEVLKGNADNEVKEAACRTLGKIGKTEDNSTVITGLLEVLKDNADSRVRGAACRALGKISKTENNSTVITGLLEVLKDNADSRVRGAACYALGEIGEAGDNSKVISDLLEVLKNNADSRVRGAVCWALGEIGEAGDDSKVISDLLEVLKDNADNEMKVTACLALGKISKAGYYSEVIDGLVRALEKESSSEYFLLRALTKCLHDLEDIKRLNDELLSRLELCIKYYHEYLQEVPPDIFLRFYLKLKKETWPHLAVSAALVQGVAVTAKDKIVVYGAKKPIQLEYEDEELLNNLKDACHDQKMKLFGEA